MAAAAAAIAAPVSIVGIGTYLPPSVAVRDVIAARGGDVAAYRGWERACYAGPEDHPGTMGAAALKQALERSGVRSEELKLVIYTGASRDYVPSWSVSSDIMNQCGPSDQCIGLDLTAGCLATLAALDLAQNWLPGHGGGYAAVVAAERWTQTIDFNDPHTAGLWQYGDSAGALVVGIGVSKQPVAEFLGAEFRGNAPGNGHVLIPYGGTRNPQPPPGVNPNVRKVSDRPREQITGAYRKGYGGSYDTLKQRFGIKAARFVCNQMSPQIVGMLGEVMDMKERTVVTGQNTGHLGGPDIIVGLRHLQDNGQLNEPVVVGASTAYGFGTGFVVPPQRKN
jgi:3-oxoacyl-[acyl-carrier-protein] synthase III